MALWDQIKTLMAIQPTFERIDTLQTRTIDGMDLGSSTLDDLMLRLQGASARPWHPASVREALGVPAIFGAVNLIANVTGSLTMRALRGEVELPPADRPRVIVRPDPFTIPREFYRSTAYNLASRGETWWWAAARDADGMAISVINVNPAEVTVEEDPNDLRYPIIKWRNVVMRNEDFRQLVYAKEPGALRGHGPLQMCGAAISVSVEAQEWAANFYSEGGGGGDIVKTAGDLSDMTAEEMAALKDQWNDKDNNTTRFIDQGIESVTNRSVNVQGAQMLEARSHQNIDVATMFNMDATLLNAAVAGSSLTYQNVGTKFEDFLRQCLRPNYLEVIEQTMSDFLPRAIVSRFNTAALTLADIKTRYDVYGVGIDKGIITAEQAQSFEGIAPGDVENAAVPYSPPQAIPGRLPIQLRSEAVEVRCDGKRMLRGLLKPCGRLLSTTGSFAGMCPRCKKQHDIRAALVPVVRETVMPLAMRSAPTLRVVEPEPVEAPPEPPPPPQVLVQPTINLPASPVTMNFEMPKAEAHILEVRGEVSSLGGYMAELAGHIERLSTDQASLGARLAGVADSQDELVDKLNQPPKARTFVPSRDENGVIVSVTEAAS
jgi:HK97 family phage portal protein